jgi:hypothetical protein
MQMKKIVKKSTDSIHEMVEEVPQGIYALVQN